MFERDTILSFPISELKDWTFDKKVAKVFPDMVSRSIPGYFSIISIIGMLAKQFVRPNTQVYDLGCSIGEVTLSIKRSVPNSNYKIISVDNSSEMIRRCRLYINLCKFSKTVEIIESDVRDIEIKNASMVVLNFTLQFLPLKDRQKLLNEIYQGMNFGGVLVISEKFYFKDTTIHSVLLKMHCNFKRANGYSFLEIKQKEIMLKNVMLTDSVKNYKKHLKKIGFSHVELFFQYLNFGSLIAIK